MVTPAEVRLKRDGDCRSGERRSTAILLSFRGGVLPYSRASLSYVHELTYSVYLCIFCLYFRECTLHIVYHCDI